MITNKKRIRNLSRYLAHVKPGTEITVGVTDINRFTKHLVQVGFSPALEHGDTVLPAVVGPVTRFNAHGCYKPDRTKPMEKAYRTIEWHWTEYHGPDAVEQSDYKDVPYWRYPRTFIAPPSVELSIATNTADEKVVIGPALKYEPKNEALLLHTINVFLEVFGECQFFTGDLAEIIRVPLRRYNWTVLPKGKQTWPNLKKSLAPVVEKARGGNQPVIFHRLETINSYGPDFVAVGNAGFSGYIIMGFEDEDFYVCESIHKDNATYVFGEGWETLSQRTKAEILSKKLHKARIVHREGWEGRLSELFSN